ncbi:hypothetical protein C8A01DRAFT_16892 [Parachaetomium inaequale]|uniref:CHCH domain-containing protein n=1 Tax=Parachaetomium inaequale TaxID=2588326 RepID=A0AAN6SR67_9PEZI|nr:hypothetical protein C8A01DRAFT_16892 [Parachaetomium inaequale]
MGSATSKEDALPKVEQQAPAVEQDDDDEPDEWDKRIFSTGCADENAKMTDCYYETKDWRACKDEMEKFRQCWKAQGNDKRTDTKDA